MADNRPLALFDSGVGGLSILLEIKKILPNETIIYFADQKNTPYSNKKPKQIKAFSKKITGFLASRDVKLIVIACNTVTCYAIKDLRKDLSIPIIGTVPAIKPAAKNTKNGKIAVLSTRSTAKSKYLKGLIKTHASNTKVLVLSSQKLVELIEKGDLYLANETFLGYLKKINSFAADTLVLGCTHFPFLKDFVPEHAVNKIAVIDSGQAVAKQVKNILSKSKMLASQKQNDRYFTSASPLEFSKVASYLLKYKVEAQKKVL